MATLSQLAVHLFLSQQRIRDLISAGVLEKKDRGEYDLNECRKAYITNLRDRVSEVGYRGNKSAGLTEERARLAKEQADAKEMENEIYRSKLVQIDDVAKIVEGQFDRCRAKLLAIPTKTAPEVHAAADHAEARAILEHAITEAMNELVGYDEKSTGGKA